MCMYSMHAHTQELRFDSTDKLSALHWWLVGGPKRCLDAASKARQHLGREHARFRAQVDTYTHTRNVYI